MCGKETDFDPDALVQNAVYALCGPYGSAALAPPAQAGWCDGCSPDNCGGCATPAAPLWRKDFLPGRLPSVYRRTTQHCVRQLTQPALHPLCSMSEKPTLARGGELTAETWADFVQRLSHDCVGEGVSDHCTANAVFVVEQLVEDVVPDGYGGYPIIFDGCDSSQKPNEFFADCCDETKAKLNESCDGSFLEADGYDQEAALKNHLPEYSLLYVRERWEFLNQHFTKDAADAFIKRKKHDYCKGLRVYVDSTYYSWELNTIKEAILAGRIGLLSESAAAQKGSND